MSITTAIEPLIKQRLNPQTLSYRPCAIVMGQTGAGKTTLVNGLCGTHHAAGEGKGSVTRNLYRNDVNCGNNTFSLIDTPGTDSSTETYKHAILLRGALTVTKINTIFIVIKYEGRFDKMTQNYFEVEQPVYNYAKKVVVMISQWDLSKNPGNSYREICELFQEECPNVTNLIFCSEGNSKTQIANLMYSCISNMTNEKLKINDTDFFLKFNTYQMKNQMKISFGQYQKRAKLLENEYTELIHSTKLESVEDKDEVLHMTIVKFKDEMETFLKEFQQEHGSAMNELDYYAFYVKMEKENVRICDEFVEKVVPSLSYNLFDNKDPRNLIKRCPHCRLIWFKTEGCDGATTCGNAKFANPEKTSGKAFWKYQVTRVDGKLRWTKNAIRDADYNSPNEAAWKILEQDSEERAEAIRQNPFRRSLTIEQASAKMKSKGVGCGKGFKWSDLPKIEDKLILELFKVKTIDQAKQIIEHESFAEARQNYETSIDTRFYF